MKSADDYAPHTPFFMVHPGLADLPAPDFATALANCKASVIGGKVAQTSVCVAGKAPTD
jgi:hypothetical protein